jgi:DNA-binding IclR family transcriptional regulator
VEHCFAAIELLAEDGASLPVSDIAARLGLPQPDLRRLLATMSQAGWVELDTETGRYQMTLRLAVLSQRFLFATHIPDVCQPVLDRLARETRELVRMAIVDGEALTLVASVQGAPAGLICQSPILPRMPLHATASGKAWLATLPPEEARRIVRRQGFGDHDALGPRALQSESALAHELDATRRRGWGLAVEEAEPGVGAVAAAIRPGSPPAHAVATVSVTAPMLRFGTDRIERAASLVQTAAAELARLWPLRVLHTARREASRQGAAATQAGAVAQPG